MILGTNNTIKMKKYYDREQFTWEEKEDVVNKSGQVCCHCGKPIFVGYGATVDHFIPLNKGGCNRMFNLIPLCKDCNDTKDDKLYNMDYIVYIKDKYRKELENYLNSYVQVTDYIKRNRLLAYDEYTESITIRPQSNFRKKNTKGIVSKYKIKLATWNDLDKMTDYLIRYLKKNDSLDDEDAARENIIFWMQFGCIYYIERNNEITVMFAVTIKHLSEDEDFRGIVNMPCIYIFPYYQTDMSYNIVKNTIYDLPKLICQENKLNFIPINILFLKVDKMSELISLKFQTQIHDDCVNGFCVMHAIIGETGDYSNIHKEIDELTESERKTYDFLEKFSTVNDDMLRYFEKYADRESISWMINSILSPSLIQKSELGKYVKFTSDEE